MEIILGEIDQSDNGFLSLIRLTLDHTGGIGFKPLAVILKPLFELPRVQGLLTPFFKDLTDIVELHTLHRFIVGIVQRIQFSLLPQEGRHPFLVTQRPKSFEVEILRMQGESGNDVIGIGVAPRTGSGGIIDGQQLDDLHPRSHSPINKQA